MPRFRCNHVILSFFVLSSLAVFSDAAQPPNVVYILADDLGWTDISCQGSGYYETPNIDKLASEGIRFTQYHNCQNCQPTRAALMTGQYAARTGIYTVGGIDRFDWSMRPLRPADNVTKLPLEKVTIAQCLKAAGYSTAMFGKWHLGDDATYHPSKRGFDEAVVSDGKHFDFTTSPKVEYPEGQYLADFLTDKAIDFIKRHKDKPFFLYLPHFGVHSPHQAKAELIAKFKNKQPVGGHSNPTYAAMIASVDESVGRILTELDSLQLADKTLVVFSSDNGGVGGYIREGIKKGGGDVTDNAPLRSGKGSLYEGGTRVPWIARWPNVIPAGSVCDVPAIHVDIFPTLLDATKSSPVNDQIQDGESLLPLMKNPKASLRRTAIFQHFPGYLGAGTDQWRTTPVGLIQSGSWKLMEFFEDGRLELYNLQNDIGESKNVAANNPDVVAQLKGQMDSWRLGINAPMPTKNDSAKSPTDKAKKKKRGKKNKEKAAAAD